MNPERKTKTRAAIYLRQSLDRTGEGLAVDRQREPCEALCLQRGWIVTDTYVDNSKSASSGKPRKDYDRMLADIKAGQVDAIVAWSLDRLTRNARDRLRLIETGKAHRTIVALVRGSELDMSTPSGRMTADILGSVAQNEIEVKSDRQKAANVQRASRGEMPLGPAPFGWRKDATHEPAEARHLRRAYAAALAGATLKGIVTDWNNRGVGNGTWTHSSLRKRLLDPRNAGLRAINGEIVGKGNWRPIVDEDIWRAVHAVLTDPTRRTHVGPYARKYLLSALLLCGRCGGIMTTGRASRGHRTYVCKLRHLSRKADDIDQLVEQLVIDRLSRPDAVELLRRDPAPELDVLAERATVLKARLDDLSTLLSEGVLTSDGVRRESTRLRGDLAAVEAKLHEPDRAAVLQDLVEASDVEVVWHGLDLDRQRAIIDTLMVIILHPVPRGSRTFHPDSVGIDWRQGS